MTPGIRSGNQDRTRELLQLSGGLFSSIAEQRPAADEPQFVHSTVTLGNLAHVWPGAIAQGLHRTTVRAGGSGFDADSALAPALGEGLERYAAGLFREEQFVFASAKALEEPALDLDTVPRCSDTELGNPRCPLVAPDESQPIRWIRGISLADGQISLLPAVMVFSHLGVLHPAERFWLPISTGCAAHVSYEQALLHGILEIVERDAISVTWLQRLSLPRIEISASYVLSEELARSLAISRRASRGIEYHFLDATSTLGIPTVYGVQVSRYNPNTTTLVAASSAATISSAIAKVLRDMSRLRPGLQRAEPPPSDWEDFRDPMHGASFMMRFEQRHHFDFLTRSPRRRSLREAAASDITVDHPLQFVLERLRAHGLEAYAVDLSPDEGIRVGLRVVRVLIPGLQPLSLRHLARYLGHARLYAAPEQFGLDAYAEPELNPLPQPFS